MRSKIFDTTKLGALKFTATNPVSQTQSLSFSLLGLTLGFTQLIRAKMMVAPTPGFEIDMEFATFNKNGFSAILTPS